MLYQLLEKLYCRHNKFKSKFNQYENKVNNFSIKSIFKCLIQWWKIQQDTLKESTFEYLVKLMKDETQQENFSFNAMDTTCKIIIRQSPKF